MTLLKLGMHMATAFDPYHKWLAIPADEQPPNHYRLFGIPPLTSNADVIENAANRQAAHIKSFEDGPHGDMACGLLAVIENAKVCLLNPKLKAAYDTQLESALAEGQPRRQSTASAAVRPAAPRKSAAQPSAPAFAVSQSTATQHRHQKKSFGSAPIVAGVILFILVVAGLASVFLLRSTPVEVSQQGLTLPDGRLTHSEQLPNDDILNEDVGSATQDDVPGQAAPKARDDADATQTRPPVGDSDEGKLPSIVDPPESARNGTSEGTVDLLSMIDPSRDAVYGEWTYPVNSLLTPKVGGARLQIPYVPPDEYDLTVTATRVESNDALVIGIIHGGRQSAVVIDGWGGRRGGLDTIDGIRPDQNGSGFQGAVFARGVPTTITCSVRSSHIIVRSDQRTFMHWTGDPQRLQMFSAW